MKSKINKILSLTLLLSTSTILSMQKSNIEYEAQEMEIDQDVQQGLHLLNLPAEVINYIIYQIIKPYENRVGNINNIFKFYSQLDLKPLVSDLLGVSLASKDLRLWTLDLINRLKKLKEKKYQELVSPIKNQYQGLSQSLHLDKLNSRLKNILNRFLIDRANLEEAAKLILVGANINEKNNDGFTILMQATIGSHTDIVQLLIDNGANVNEKDINGYTALMFAAKSGYKGIVELLIAKNANVNAQNNYGYTALIWAA